LAGRLVVATSDRGSVAVDGSRRPATEATVYQSEGVPEYWLVDLEEFFSDLSD
jgi:hypothetical protein